MKEEKNELMEIEEEDTEDSDGIIPDEMGSPFDPNDIDIGSEQNSLSTIIGMIEDDAIDLNTEFQRKGNLWPKSTMSRLIESILLRLPLPAFYFDASNDQRWLVVDGLQRLWSLKKFMVDKDLVLENLLVLKALNYKGYDDLETYLKRRMARYQVTTYLIKSGTPKRVKYDIFRRINTGGLILTKQEIRNTLNQGKPSHYLKELSEDEHFKKVMNIPSKRMADHELILRYLAFSNTSYTQYKPPFSSFLDEAMEKLDELKDTELKQLEQNLWQALQICEKLFGKHIFSPSLATGNKPKLNRALFEVWTVLIGKLNRDDTDRLLLAKEDLVRKFKFFLKDEKFYQSIYSSTASKISVTKRFETIESLLKEILNDK